MLPEDVRSSLLHWLDDMLLYGRTVAELRTKIFGLFRFCVEHNNKLHPAKCLLFATSVRWCGRTISPDGIRFDPRQLDGLLEMEEPTSGAHLQQFVCAMQWLKHGIPNFATLIKPLHNFLERVYEQDEKRTKRAAGRVLPVNLGWGPTERNAFNACKRALADQVKLAHRDVEKRLCIYTDASDTFWSGIVTQVPRPDLALAHVDQRHEPLGFLSGRFNAAQLGWSTLEKEAYAVMATIGRMHWLAATVDGFDLYTDHNNLVFIFDPLSVVPDLAQTALWKVLRWAVRLSFYNYVCIHIKGTDNVWADFLGRWSARRTVRRLVYLPALPSVKTSDFDWPSSEGIAEAQQNYHTSRPPGLHERNGLLVNPVSAIWINSECEDLHLRLCTIAHTGPAGHRGRDATERNLRKHYFWTTLASDVRSFVRACIHCLSTVGAEKVPRPFGPSMHGTKPNDLLQFDYIELGPSSDGEKYVLMLRDDHSSYAWFFAFPDTSAENAACAIIDWSAAFGVPNGLMSDGPTHFKNETVRLVAKGLKTPHHFTLPYCPWSNRGVERLGKELIRTFQAVLSELQLRPGEWPDLLPLVQSALNNAPLPSRGNVAPLTAFTGQEATSPIKTFLRTETSTPVTLTELQNERTINIRDLQKAVNNLHPVVQKTVSDYRRESREAVSRGQLPKFTEGDYVLVAREDFTAAEKLALRWRGPRRVIRSLSEYVFQVEDLRNGTLEDMHGSRLKFYSDKDLNESAIMSHVLSSETGMPVSRLMRLMEDEDGELKVVVRWKGLPDSEDTLEPLQNVYEDVPRLLILLLDRKNTPPSLAQKARNILDL